MKRFAILLCALAFATICGCWRAANKPRVVVYSALDSEFSQPILEKYERATGVQVLAKFDVESTKTVGLVNEILAESRRPRCDVFWNNEILNTIRLQKRGLLARYAPPTAADYPPMYKAADGTWYGFAARARVLVVNRKLVDEAERPKSIYDLTDPKWRGRIGIAKPLFGTTATQAACLFACLGDEKAKDFFRRLKANEVQILSGNKQVALAAAGGQIAFGLTDTDDAIIELEKGLPISVVYPDREPDQIGTLFIPNTVCVLNGCPHPEAAHQLIDYLLSPPVEEALAAGASAQIPLNPAVKVMPRVDSPRTIKAMAVDFEQAAACWDRAANFIRDEFTGAE